MNYTMTSKPGMGDPYWYEWSVGEQYIIDMLNPDNGIKTVTLQAFVSLGLDDVVVSYDDDTTLFIQVKHSRTNASLTFGDLVDQDKGVSLLGQLADSWCKEKEKYTKTKVYLFTNRKSGERVSTVRKGGYKRPPLDFFWKELRSQIENNVDIANMSFPGYEEAWNEWLNQIHCIESDADKALFLKTLCIETDKCSLEEMKPDLIRRFQSVFCIKEDVARLLVVRLDHALRDWTTSNYGPSVITAEDVYQALSIQEDTISYSHDLIAAEPFFASRSELIENIEREIQDHNCHIVFVSGKPGTGKTNIISKISGKKNSIVDIRYYAYEPINPEKEYLPQDVSERVNENCFWNELFNQLRKILKGKLCKYKVPVLNNMMTIEEKSKIFFEIASKYAFDRGNDFIIAIDGIDHAARANITSNTFLQTLPYPEYIPKNIKILLAGQPKEDYKNYPMWLFDNRNDVREMKVTDIKQEDIRLLVDRHFPTESELFREQIIDLIDKYAEGNTLSAVFAVYEAELSDNLIDLEYRLKERSLSGNIQLYYKNIWDSAIRKINIPFVDYKIAGVLAFFNEPINEYKLNVIYNSEGITVSFWRNVLKALKPLLRENNGEYTILHNDVRVYLAKIIGQDEDNVLEVYSHLVDYYMTVDNKNYPYYKDVLRFLKYSKREEDFEKIYNPEFVISSYVNGVELPEIRQNTNELLRYVVSQNHINWNYIRKIVWGILTIEQIERTKYEIEGDEFRKGIVRVDVHPYECYVDATISWNMEKLSDVFSLINKLYNNGEYVRGKRLYEAWFSEDSIIDIYGYLDYEDIDAPLSQELKSIVNSITQAVCYTKAWKMVSGLSLLIEKNESFAIAFSEGLITNAFQYLSQNDICELFQSMELIILDPLVEGVKCFLFDNRFDELQKIEEILHDRLQKNSLGILLSVFLNIVAGSAKWDEEEMANLWDKIKDVELPDNMIEGLAFYYSMYALAAAYLLPGSKREIVVLVTDKYMQVHTHKNRTYISMYYNIICYIGKWIKCQRLGKLLAENIDELDVLSESLFLKKWSHNDSDFEVIQLRGLVLKAIVILSQNENKEMRARLTDICEKVIEDRPVNQLLDPGLMFYGDNPKKAQEWIDKWLGDEGCVWTEPIGDRNRIIRAFVQAKRKYDVDDCWNLYDAEEKAKWSVVGYASHKEYSGDLILNWYNALVDSDPKYIDQYAEQIKNISDAMETLGDNRMEYVLNCKVYEDLFGLGYDNIINILKTDRFLEEVFLYPRYFVEGLIGYLKNARVKRKDILIIWSIGIGLLDWRDEDNHATIHSLQRAVELCAERNGVDEIIKDLERLADGYIGLSADPVKYVIPERWCDQKRECKSSENPQEIIGRYLSSSDKCIVKTDVFDALNQLNNQGLLKADRINELLKYEFESGVYGIRGNAVIEYLVPMAEERFFDSIVREYIITALNREGGYLETDLPEIIKWKSKCLNTDYCKEGLDELVAMHKSWMTAANHFSMPTLKCAYDYSVEMNWSNVTDFMTLGLQTMLVMVLSEDADAARTALCGIFSLLRVDAPNSLGVLEQNWDRLHYRAKEWLMMTYELLWYFDIHSHETLGQILRKHASDKDFNVALYSNLLLETFGIIDQKKYIKKAQDFFSDIPLYSTKKLIKTVRKNLWINGYECVMEQKERLEKRLKMNLIDVETRTAGYIIKDSMKLIPLQRSSSGFRVVCDDVNRAFFRVLYKDWLYGRWDGYEAELGRVILSASEPYSLLITPTLWKHDNCKIFSDLEGLIGKPDDIKKRTIENVLEKGVDESYFVASGGVIDYTYKREFFGFLVSYLDSPETNDDSAICNYEHNSRVFLQSREDFNENSHINFTLHHNGIESFKQSNIMCGFSGRAMSTFGWKYSIDDNGIRLVDEKGEIIGYFEQFFGFKCTVSNRCPSNQPVIQRWLVNKHAVTEAIKNSACPYRIKQAVGYSERSLKEAG